jgi:hypothetical protein
MIDTNLSRKSNGAGQHDQIIHFVGGIKRLIQGVLYVWENEMTHVVDYLGIEYVINKNNVLFVERISYGGQGTSGVKGGSDEADKHKDGRVSKKGGASTRFKTGRGNGRRVDKGGKRKSVG